MKDHQNKKTPSKKANTSDLVEGVDYLNDENYDN